MKTKNKPFPSETHFLDKFFAALEEDPELRDAYFERFDPNFIPFCPEDSRDALLMTFAFYGGYRVRRRLIECVPIDPNDTVLDIGPETGTECFMLAERYRRVLVAEPDARTADLIRQLSEHYITEDGRRASEIIGVRRAGIIPPGSYVLTNCEGTPRGPVYFDARGAADIVKIFGERFASRTFLNHLALMVPQEPKIEVLLRALDSYCAKGGVITWCDSVSELSEIVMRSEHDDNAPVEKGKAKLARIKEYIVARLPDYDVAFHVNRKPHQLMTIARRRDQCQYSALFPDSVQSAL